MNTKDDFEAFKEALSKYQGQGTPALQIPGDVYDQWQAQGMDMDGLERVPTAKERQRALRQEIAAERHHLDYLASQRPLQGKPVKPWKAERKAKLKELQRKAFGGAGS